MNLHTHRQQYKPLREPGNPSRLAAWGAAFGAIALLLSMYAIAAHNDERMRIAEAIETRASTVLAKAEERKQRAARAICRQAHPAAQPRWTDTGDLSCTVVALASTRSAKP